MWTWNEVKSENWNNGTFETKEEAIRDAKDNGFSIFYIGECEIIPFRTDVDSDEILERLDELYSDESGCDDYIYEGVSDEDKKWLEDKLSELIVEFNKRIKIEPNWYRVFSEEHIVMKKINTTEN